MSYDHVYDAGFYDYISLGAQRSAKQVVAALRQVLPALPASVVDVGCGYGVWARTFSEQPEVTEVIGLDGDYIDVNNIAIPAGIFRPCDLSKPFDLGHRFDMAVTLEVAEHLPTSSSADFVSSLVRHSDMVLFSAAIPGQGGEHHINEQPLEFWRDQFARHGYVCFDALRPHLRGKTDIEPWYRYNMLLFVKDDLADSLMDKLGKYRVADGAPLANYASLGWRIRCAALRCLPRTTVDWLATLKHNVIRWQRSAAAGAQS
jgi:SAM-dependent methyltransferase